MSAVLSLEVWWWIGEVVGMEISLGGLDVAGGVGVVGDSWGLELDAELSSSLELSWSVHRVKKPGMLDVDWESGVSLGDGGAGGG